MFQSLPRINCGSSYKRWIFRRVSFSSQHADQCTMEENGIETSLNLWDNLQILFRTTPLRNDAGRAAKNAGPISFISLTDFIQRPCSGSRRSQPVYRDMDQRFGRLQELGALVALLNHGMGDKSAETGNRMWSSSRTCWINNLVQVPVRLSARSRMLLSAIMELLMILSGFTLRGSGSSRSGHSIESLEGVERVWIKEEAAKDLELPDVKVLLLLQTRDLSSEEGNGS